MRYRINDGENSEEKDVSKHYTQIQDRKKEKERGKKN